MLELRKTQAITLVHQCIPWITKHNADLVHSNHEVKQWILHSVTYNDKQVQSVILLYQFGR